MKIIIITIPLLFFLSCKSSVIEPDQDIETDFKYPYNTGSLWYYTVRNFIYNIRPDSIKTYYSTDTSISFGVSTFQNDTIINNFDTVRIFKNDITSGHGAVIFEYYKQTNTGLIRYASNTVITGFGPYRVSEKTGLIFNNKGYNSIAEIFLDLNESYITPDSLLYDVPPRTALKYPITVNSSWDLSNNNNTRITKTYLDYEYVNLNAGNFYCIKVQKKFYFNNSPQPNDNLIFYDYFSKEGMVKRDYFIKNIPVSNSQGQHIGFIDAKEEIFLNLYSLP